MRYTRIDNVRLLIMKQLTKIDIPESAVYLQGQPIVRFVLISDFVVGFRPACLGTLRSAQFGNGVHFNLFDLLEQSLEMTRTQTALHLHRTRSGLARNVFFRTRDLLLQLHGLRKQSHFSRWNRINSRLLRAVRRQVNRLQTFTIDPISTGIFFRVTFLLFKHPQRYY